MIRDILDHRVQSYDVRVQQEGLEALESYERIPMRFEVSSRVDIDHLRHRLGGLLKTITVDPYWKDYDEYVDERPTSLSRRFDMSSWGIFSAFEGEERVGGAIVAYRAPAYELLEGRSDLAALVDIRVAPEAQGREVGRTLFTTARGWATGRSCLELRVETQDTNVAACRFYAAMGCDLHSIEEGAYGPTSDEARLIWKISLQSTSEPPVLER
jgi:GNAT superfamily N-acetyltransferase